MSKTALNVFIGIILGLIVLFFGFKFAIYDYIMARSDANAAYLQETELPQIADQTRTGDTQEDLRD